MVRLIITTTLKLQNSCLITIFGEGVFINFEQDFIDNFLKKPELKKEWNLSEMTLIIVIKEERFESVSQAKKATFQFRLFPHSLINAFTVVKKCQAFSILHQR